VQVRDERRNVLTDDGPVDPTRRTCHLDGSIGGDSEHHADGTRPRRVEPGHPVDEAEPNGLRVTGEVGPVQGDAVGRCGERPADDR